MKEITILSGKGGTGKTSVTAALASVAENTVFCDNDVDAADLHLIFRPEIKERHQFSSGWKVSIDANSCTNCGICVQNCRFDAIYKDTQGDLAINPFQCEGCRLCERTCPSNAITSFESKNNYWFVSDSRFGSFVHAQMGAGEENSGRLVTQIRRKAREIAKENASEYVINDGPPGIGCATIASLSGTNCVLLVIEPTKSGLHDAQRLIELIASFKIETYAIINKHDINVDVAAEIELFLQEKGILLLAKIAFDEAMVQSITNGKTIVEFDSESAISKQIRDIWEIMKK